MDKDEILKWEEEHGERNVMMRRAFNASLLGVLEGRTKK